MTRHPDGGNDGDQARSQQRCRIGSASRMRSGARFMKVATGRLRLRSSPRSIASRIMNSGNTTFASIKRPRPREGNKASGHFEHSLCPMGRKQGPIVHSLTLLPKEKSRSTNSIDTATPPARRRDSASAPRSSSYVSRVTDTLASVKTNFGTAFSSVLTSAAGSSGGGVIPGYRQLRWRSFIVRTRLPSAIT